jgi:tetratricopeptide (TPR) repeat protein
VAQGQHEDAIRRFRQAAATDPLLTDPAAGTEPMRAAAAAMKQNRLSEARTHLEAALARAPDSSEAHRLLGIVSWAAQQEALSIRHLETAIRVNPRDERSRLALARVHSTAGRYEDAERVLRLTIDDFPESALARWWRGSLYDVLHRVPEARREYELAAAAALAGEGPLYAAIGRLARIEADFEGAVQAFTRQVRVMPHDAAARRQLASAYLEQDRVDEAFAELQAALAIDPRDAEAYAAIGQLHLDAGRDVDALAALRRALDLKPALAEARYALAASLMRLGRSEEAARELEAFERIQRQALAKQRKEMAEQVLKEGAALGSGQGRPR